MECAIEVSSMMQIRPALPRAWRACREPACSLYRDSRCARFEPKPAGRGDSRRGGSARGSRLGSRRAGTSPANQGIRMVSCAKPDRGTRGSARFNLYPACYGLPRTDVAREFPQY